MDIKNMFKNFERKYVSLVVGSALAGVALGYSLGAGTSDKLIGQFESGNTERNICFERKNQSITPVGYYSVNCDIKLERSDSFTQLTIMNSKDSLKDYSIRPVIFAKDNGSDGTFEEIYVNNASIADPLFEFANAKFLEGLERKLYDEEFEFHGW